jgi:putative chitinase
MCIIHTVGDGGRNIPADVRGIQLLLNLNGAQPDVLLPDGQWGARSRLALEGWRQRLGMDTRRPVAPGDATLEALRLGLPTQLVEHKLWALLIEASERHITVYQPLLVEMLARYRIDTPLRIAHFFAQIAHESGCLRYSEELASGAAYEGRRDLGNLHAGDGPRFKGRGLIQLTGRANYRQYGQACQRDFEHHDDPALLGRDLALAVDVAGWFWNRHALNGLADRDDLLGITRRINGGLNGLEQRAAYLARGKWLLMA